MWPNLAVGPTRVLNSLWTCWETKLYLSKNRFLVDQNRRGTNKILKRAAIQLRGRLREEDGSKIENKLVIIVRSRNLSCVSLF